MGVIVVIFALIVAGIGFFVKKYPDTISGYASMSAEKRKNVDIAAVGDLLCKGFRWIAVAMLVIYFVFALLGKPVLALTLGLLAPIFTGTIVLMIMSQKYDTNPRSRFRKYLPTGIVIFLAVAIGVLMAVVVPRDMKPTEAVVGRNAVEFSGSYGVVVPFAEITACELLDDIPRIRVKMGGFALGKVCKGDFRLDSLGRCRLFVRLGRTPYLCIETTSGRKIIFNSPDSAVTRDLYRDLNSAVTEQK